MSKIGFYRWKIENATTQDVTLYINNVVASVKRVVARPVCTGFKMLRWLDRNGQFRFYPFNAEYAVKYQPNQIGEVNNIVSSLLDYRSDTKNVGYNATRTLTLRATQVSQTELNLLSDIYISPRVSLYIGDLSKYEETDWVDVTVSGDNIARRDKLNFGKVELTITLPKHHTITMQ